MAPAFASLASYRRIEEREAFRQATLLTFTHERWEPEMGRLTSRPKVLTVSRRESSSPSGAPDWTRYQGPACFTA